MPAATTHRMGRFEERATQGREESDRHVMEKGRDEFSPARFAHSSMLMLKPLVLRADAILNDDRSMTSTMHNKRPTACTHALHVHIIMYAPFALS
jgi:hypothetical protein